MGPIDKFIANGEVLDLDMKLKDALQAQYSCICIMEGPKVGAAQPIVHFGRYKLKAIIKEAARCSDVLDVRVARARRVRPAGADGGDAQALFRKHPALIKYMRLRDAHLMYKGTLIMPYESVSGSMDAHPGYSLHLVHEIVRARARRARARCAPHVLFGAQSDLEEEITPQRLVANCRFCHTAGAAMTPMPTCTYCE